MRYFIAVLFLCIPNLPAQTTEFSFDPTVSGGSFAMEYDSSGIGHALVIEQESLTTNLVYFTYSGDAWTEEGVVSTASGQGMIIGVDLEIAPDRSLHASFIDDRGINYATLAEGASNWQTEMIESNSLLPQVSELGAEALSIFRTSIVLSNGSPRVAFNFLDSAGGSSTLGSIRYAYLDANAWQVEDVPDTENTFLPVLANESLPVAGFVLGTRGPSIAYVRGDEVFVRERSNGFGSSAPGWLAPQYVDDIVTASGGILLSLPQGGLGFEIRDRVLHLALFSYDEEDELGLYYHNWRVGLTLNGQEVIKRREEIEAPALHSGSSSVDQLAMDINPQGNPVILRTMSIGGFIGSQQSISLNERVGQSDWNTSLLTDFNVPVASRAKISIGPLGGAMALLVDDDAQSDDSKLFAYDVSDNSWIASDVSDRAELATDGEMITIVSDRRGGVATTSLLNGLFLQLNYISPTNGQLSSHAFTLDFENGSTGQQILDLQSCAVGSDRHVLAAQTSSSAGARVVLSLFEGSQFIQAQSYPLPSSNSAFAITSTGSGLILATFGNGNAEFTQIGADLSDQGLLAVPSFIPGSLREVTFASRSGALAVVGDLAGELTGYFVNASGETAVNSLGSLGAGGIASGYDVEVSESGISYLVAYVDDGDLTLGRSRAVFGAPQSGAIDLAQIETSVANTAVELSLTAVNEIHLLSQNLSSLITSVSLRKYSEFSTAIESNLISERELTLDGLASQPSSTLSLVTASDSLGYPVFLHRIDRVSSTSAPVPEAYIYRSLLALDQDGDGMPFLHELAAGFEPSVRNAASTPTLDLYRPINEATDRLTFRRVPGPALADSRSLTVGSFRYQAERSSNLQTFSPTPFPFAKSYPEENGQILGIPASDGHLQNVDFKQSLGSSSFGFYQVKVSAR
ncbi:hypothetical protein [Roseibacillus persicicus]|uniref:Uncharacterized protein n=1 Tax=Roseibacillus persicicus TaxID=454148 RepID=A0A918WK60_9BACT|nr:hypothetical protein [Roseibacillus persicicus]GHC54911.1 hypothetical protein GCM10007100_21860 [Roseibacillus persicicus]